MNTQAYFSAISINDTQLPIKHICGGFFKGSLNLLEVQKKKKKNLRSSSKTNTENHQPRKSIDY